MIYQVSENCLLCGNKKRFQNSRSGDSRLPARGSRSGDFTAVRTSRYLIVKMPNARLESNAVSGRCSFRGRSVCSFLNRINFPYCFPYSIAFLMWRFSFVCGLWFKRVGGGHGRKLLWQEVLLPPSWSQPEVLRSSWGVPLSSWWLRFRGR